MERKYSILYRPWARAIRAGAVALSVFIAGAVSGVAQPSNVWWELGYLAAVEDPARLLGAPEFRAGQYVPWVTPRSGPAPGSHAVVLDYSVGSISADARFSPGRVTLALDGVVSSYQPMVSIGVDEAAQAGDGPGMDLWREAVFPPAGVELAVRNRGDGVRVELHFADERRNVRLAAIRITCLDIGWLSSLPYY